MRGVNFPFSVRRSFSFLTPVLALAGCSSSQPPKVVQPAPAAAAPLLKLPPNFTVSTAPSVMLGIDVLEAEGFARLKGKRVGLLTHPAAVNRYGVSTIDVLRRAPGVKLVALYGVEHGVYGELLAEKNYEDHIDPRTGLMIYSLYNGRTREATAAQLKPIDALIVDLQDIGTRSYTFVSAMKLAMQACFKAGKEIIVLDRPNPLGGLKVDGPLLDQQLGSYVGAFGVPYVHGLTIGELALMAKDVRPPSVSALAVSESARARGKLTVVPMRGWTRSMRWPETALPWVATSQMIQDFAAIEGYPMVGLGTYSDPRSNFDIGFSHGIGKAYPFRGLSHRTAKIDVLEKEFRALNLPGLKFRRVSGVDALGKPAVGLFVEIYDYADWNPTELNFHLMKLACKLDPRNPFAPIPRRDFSGFLRHMGSEAFLRELQRDGARIDVDKWIRLWREQDRVYQQQSKKYWLYH
jgi:uncharacterized protein YbbC (DUF1343 family)